MLRASICLLLTGYLGAASFAVAQQPVVAKPAPDPRVAELQSGTPERKLEVLRDLRYAKPKTVEGVIAEVYRCMHEDPDRRVRLAAHRAITFMHQQATAGLANDVEDAFDEPASDLDDARYYAALAVLTSPHAFPNYIDTLIDCRFDVSKGSSPEDVLIGYVHRLGNFGYSWRSPDPRVRKLVLSAVLQRERVSKEILDDYLKRDIEASKQEKVLLLQALVRSFPPSGEPLQRVLVALEDPEDEVGLAAVDCLGEWGSSTTPYLLKVAQDRSSRLRARCYSALVTNRPLDAEILAVLTAAVATDDESMATNAAHALSDCGKDAAAAVPSLVARLAACQDPDPSGYYQLPMAIVRALAEIGPTAKEADGELRSFLERVDRKHHPDIAEALAKINADAELALPILKRVMELAAQDTNHSEMRHAMYVTNRLGLKPASLTPILIDYLTTAHYLHRSDKAGYTKRRLAVWRTVDFLGEMGSAAQSGLPALRQMAEATDYEDDQLRDKLQIAIDAIENAKAGPQ